MDKTGGTLYYTPERVCKLVISTMIPHNICVKHGLQLEQEMSIEMEEDIEIDPMIYYKWAGNSSISNK